MYRDLIGDPERFELNGRDWWMQIFRRWSGKIKYIRLYNEEGDFVSEFRSADEALAYITGAK